MDDLDYSRPLDVHRWSDFPEVKEAVGDLFQELKTTNAASSGTAGKLKKHLTVVLMDLYHNHLAFPGAYTAYSRNRNSYGGPSRYNKLHIKYRPLMRVIDGLQELGYIENVKGFFDRSRGAGKQSRMRATARLIEFIEHRHAIIPNMISKVGDEETIILKDADGKEINYPETRRVRRMRAKVEAYNAQIGGAEIGLSAEGERIAAQPGVSIDFSAVKARRVFNRGRFNLGGRFYRTWWQNISKELRKHILINGNPTVEYDYSAQHIHLLYGRKGVNYFDLFGDDDDPYSLPDQEPRSRKVLKIILLVALNAETKTKALRASHSELREKLPREEYEGIEISELIEAFRTKHTTIAHHLFTGIGLRLQNIDSEISEYVLSTIIKQDITVLGIHDSFIVEREYANLLINTMIDAFHHFSYPSIPPIKETMLEPFDDEAMNMNRGVAIDEDHIVQV